MDAQYIKDSEAYNAVQIYKNLRGIGVKKVAILQSNYIPWKGYFDMIAAVDEFILYDDMQYTRRDWRNRNQIKTPQGAQWLSLPVKVKGKFEQKIRDTELESVGAQKAHWRTIVQNYKRAPHFKEVSEFFAPYFDVEHTHLSTLNRSLIEAVCAYLGITTKISNCWDYQIIDGKTERLASLCEQAGGTEYISGPAAKDYVVPEVFSEKGIQLTWFSYAGYQPYPQLWGEFTHAVSILDLLFNCGKESPQYMNHARLIESTQLH